MRAPSPYDLRCLKATLNSNELTNIFCIHRLPIRPATLYSLSQVNWLSSASHLETQHGESMSWMRGLQLLQQGCFLWQFTGCVLYTYTVSRVAYTDNYRACIWTSHGEFRYERYESVYVTLHYQKQKLNFNRDGLKPDFSTDFDAFYFSHFVTRWRYFRSSIYCQIRRLARLAFVCLWTLSPEIKQTGRYTLQKQRHSSVLLRLHVYRRRPVQGHCW